MKFRATLSPTVISLALSSVRPGNIYGFPAYHRRAETDVITNKVRKTSLLSNVTRTPVSGVTRAPNFAPTQSPSKEETGEPTESPTLSPLNEETYEPAQVPTKEETANLTQAPAREPTTEPTPNLTTELPTPKPKTEEPTAEPTEAPPDPIAEEPKDSSVFPTESPFKPNAPTKSPSFAPTDASSFTPTEAPSTAPTRMDIDTGFPSLYPFSSPPELKSSYPSSSSPQEGAQSPFSSPSRTFPPTVLSAPSLSASPSLSPRPTITRTPTQTQSFLPTLTHGPSDIPYSVPAEAFSDSPSRGMTNVVEWSSSPSAGGTATESTLATESNTTPSLAPINVPVTKPPVEVLVSEIQKIEKSIQITISLSLWSPKGIPRAEEDFKLISDAVLTSIRMLYCEDPFVFTCVVRHDLLLASKGTFVSQTKQESARQKTLLVPAIEKVVAVEDDSYAYTSWDIAVEVIQLGAPCIHELLVALQEAYSVKLSAEDILKRIPNFIQEKVTADINKSIHEGTFDGLLHSILAEDQIVTSVPGNEEATFGVLIPPQVEHQEAMEAVGADLTLITIYVAIAVVIIISGACMVMLYYYKHTAEKTSSEPSEKQKYENEDSDIGDDYSSGPRFPPTQCIGKQPPMITPSVAGEAVAEDHSTAVASWQYRPRRFVLQSDSQVGPPESDGPPDDGTDFPTAGSIVAGSVMVGSAMAESVESSLDGWSVSATDFNLNWA